MKAILAIIGVTLLVSVAIVLTAGPTESQPAPAKPVGLTKYEIGPPDPTEMLELVNKEREKAGVAPLEYDENVEKSAQLKATDFSERDYYSHIVKGTKYTLTDEMAHYVHLSCESSSENINADVYTSQQAHNKWMASEPHRKAILDPSYQSTGFGVSQEKDGDYFAVQRFCVAL